MLLIFRWDCSCLEKFLSRPSGVGVLCTSAQTLLRIAPRSSVTGKSRRSNPFEA